MNASDIESLILEIYSKEGASGYHVAHFKDTDNYYTITEKLQDRGLLWTTVLPSFKQSGQSRIYNVFPEFHTKIDTLPANPIGSFLKKVSGDAFYAVIVASKENIPMAIISKEGKPIYFLDIMTEFTKTCTKKQLQEMVKLVVEKCNSLAEFSAPAEQKDLILSIIANLINDGKLTKDKMSEIEKHVNSQVKQLLNSSGRLQYISLINNSRMYRKILAKVLETEKNAQEEGFNRGLGVGLGFFSGLSRAGYTFEHRDGCWYKDVKIQPKHCIKSEKVYLIDLEKIHADDKYIIKRLKFNPKEYVRGVTSFRLNVVDGKHPNVSSGDAKVCIGRNLESKWLKYVSDRSHFDEYQFGEFLLEVESVLEFINYDSSYFKPGEYYWSHIKEEKVEGVADGEVTPKAKAGATFRRLE